MARKQLQIAHDQAVSRDGFTFDPASLRWRLSRNVIVSMQWAPNALDQQLMASFLSVLRVYAETSSAHHVNNLADRFRAFATFISNPKGPMSEIGAVDLINYRSELAANQEWYLGVLNGFFKKWCDLGYSGVDHELVELLSSWRLRSNQKGKAVQRLCPYEGALSDLEYQALQKALVDAFEQDQMNLEDFVLVNLFMATGRRPAQISDLKACDLVEAKSSDGLAEFVLQIPRRKQHGLRWREEFRVFALAPELGAMLMALIRQTKRTFIADFGAASALDQLAIFPSWKRLRQYQNEGWDELKSELSDQWFHRNPSSLTERLKRAVRRLRVYSERTGDVLEVFSIRLRRTMGTRAAREGYGPLIIGELLDHSDTQNAFVYTENVPEHLDRIDRAVAEQLAPIAQAFAGVLVDRESDAERGDDLTSRVRSNESRNGVGTCGHYGFCGAFAPIACYTCRHFQPWLDGPHGDVMDHLLTERERIKAKTNDPEMAAVNDRTIFAVQQVVQLCEERWREREESADG